MSASAPQLGATSYDQIEYTARSFPRLSPARLGGAALVFGLNPPPPSQCRMLELGCGQGSTLLALAQIYPDSEFQGVDLSVRHVENARRLAQKSGLKNVRFEHRSIADISSERDGEYDYIVSHGVYSWVPGEIKEKILEICGRQLTPSGISYVSYNTLPGWAHLRVIREMLIYHTERYEDPLEKHAQAKTLVSFLRESAPGGKDGWLAKWLQSVEQLLMHSEPAYFLHEYLEETNDPCFFHQFMERASAHGLQYLCESDLSRNFPASLGPQAGKVIEMLKRSLIEAEQYMDFARNTQFRCTLLCRQDALAHREFQPDRLQQVLFALSVRPVDPGKIDLTHGAPAEFLFPNGSKFTAQDTVIKAGLLALAERPGVFHSLPAVKAGAARILRERNLSDAPAERPEVMTLLTKLVARFVSAGVAEISLPDLGAFLPERSVPEQPFTVPLARAQAAEKSPVLRNTLHSAPAPEAILALLPFCDGSRTHDELFAVYRDLLQKRAILPPVPSQPDQPADLSSAFSALMKDLAQGSLLWKPAQTGPAHS